jgi:O-antigen ligase
VRGAARSGACLALLAGPTVLAFFTGGYFDSPRAVAGLVAWILVVVALLTGSSLPRGLGPRLALGGLALFALWTLVSFTWAPVAGNAYHAGQRVVLYAGALLAAALLLRDAPARRAVEPALAAGTLIVVGYGLSERLLPGLLQFSRSVSAQGRLEQPLTYWNAMGEVAALGAVLAVRLAGDATRHRALRTAAACAVPALGLGLYITFSRGALFACAAGLVTLIVAAPRREQLRALLAGLTAGVVAALAAAPQHGFTLLAGTLGTREREGAVMIAVLATVTVAAGLYQWRAGGEAAHDRALRLPRRAATIAFAVIGAGLAIAIVAGAKESANQPLAAGATRFVTFQSNRYAYWRVALRAFGTEPLHGVGAGGWLVWWLRYRPFDEGAQDAHSLPLQTAAELGLIGLALLAVFLAGMWIAARGAYRRAPALAAGPIAAFVVYLAHAPLDWDWQMPAVTLIALVLAGLLLALADNEQPSNAAVSTAQPSTATARG